MSQEWNYSYQESRPGMDRTVKFRPEKNFPQICFLMRNLVDRSFAHLENYYIWPHIGQCGAREQYSDLFWVFVYFKIYGGLWRPRNDVQLVPDIIPYRLRLENDSANLSKNRYRCFRLQPIRSQYFILPVKSV